MQLFSNLAQTYITNSLGLSDTTIYVASTDGGLFSAPTTAEYELLTLTDGTYWEVVKLTSRTGDTLTVERAYEGIARTWVSGSILKNSVTKDTMENMVQREEVDPMLAVFMYQNFS